MSRTYKDRPYRLGGDRHPHALANLRGYPKHKKACQRKKRAWVRDALKKGQEPEPRYPVERAYYD